MRQYVLALACAVFAASLVSLAAPKASADNDTGIWTGQVVHVSTTNIKVHNGEGCGQTLSFLLVPKFNQVFSDQGNTTVQMTDVKPGSWVTVYYDQSALGARHADKIVVLNNGTSIKS